MTICSEIVKAIMLILAYHSVTFVYFNKQAGLFPLPLNINVAGEVEV